MPKLAELFNSVVGDKDTKAGSNGDNRTYIQKVRDAEAAEEAARKTTKPVAAKKAAKPAPAAAKPEKKAERTPQERIEGRKDDDFNGLSKAFGEAMGFPKERKPVKKPSVTEEDESDDGGVDIAIPPTYEKGKKGRKAEEEEQEEEQDDSDSTEQEEEPQKKGAQKRKRDEADVEVDEAESESLLGDQSGEPDASDRSSFSEEATEQIAKLKQHLDYYIKKSKKIQAQVEGFDPNMKKELDELRDAHGKLKQRFQDNYFEETEEWRETFIQPLKSAESEMVKWMQSHSVGDDAEASALFKPMLVGLQEALKEGDEVKYYEWIDEIGQHLKKGSSSRFSQAAPKLWDAYIAKEQAFKDKNAAREKIRKESLSFAQKQGTIAASALDTMLHSFEDSNREVIDAYKNNTKFKDYIKYDETVGKPLADAKQAIATAVQQRKVTTELVDLAFKGAISGLKDKELEGYRARIELQKKEIERLREKVGETEKIMKKVQPSPSARRSVTEEQESEEPMSMVDVYRKRMGR